MNRAKPYKILFVLAVMVAGGICMLLPDKNVMPVASMNGVVQDSNPQSDTVSFISSDSNIVE